MRKAPKRGRDDGSSHLSRLRERSDAVAAGRGFLAALTHIVNAHDPLPRLKPRPLPQAGEVTDSRNLQPIGCNKISTIPITVKRRNLMGTHQQSWWFTKMN